MPAIEFLEDCPTKVAANLLAVLDAVAEAPPPQYSGGGKWEAMLLRANYSDDDHGESGGGQPSANDQTRSSCDCEASP